jgi:hypothetical protein
MHDEWAVTLAGKDGVLIITHINNAAFSSIHSVGWYGGCEAGVRRVLQAFTQLHLSYVTPTLHQRWATIPQHSAAFIVPQ